jgi:hypothetical protein
LNNRGFFVSEILFLAISVLSASNDSLQERNIVNSKLEKAICTVYPNSQKSSFVSDVRNNRAACLQQATQKRYAILYCNNGVVFRPLQKTIEKPLCLGVNKDLLFVLIKDSKNADLKFCFYNVFDRSANQGYFNGDGMFKVSKPENADAVDELKRFFDMLSEEQKEVCATCRTGSNDSQFIWEMNDCSFVIEKKKNSFLITKNDNDSSSVLKEVGCFGGGNRTTIDETSQGKKGNLFSGISLFFSVSMFFLKIIDCFIRLKLKVESFCKRIRNG